MLCALCVCVVCVCMLMYLSISGTASGVLYQLVWLFYCKVSLIYFMEVASSKLGMTSSTELNDLSQLSTNQH